MRKVISTAPLHLYLAGKSKIPWTRSEGLESSIPLVLGFLIGITTVCIGLPDRQIILPKPSSMSGVIPKDTDPLLLKKLFESRNVRLPGARKVSDVLQDCPQIISRPAIVSGRIHRDADTGSHETRRRHRGIWPTYHNPEPFVFPHQPMSAQIRRFDHAVDRNVECPFENGGESGHLLLALLQNVNLDGAIAFLPLVWYTEACVGFSAEGQWCEGFVAHGYSADCLFAFYVFDRCQLGFTGWILAPTSNRGGDGREGNIADERGN
ncbi:hypothetical protein BDR22DRAFT_500563 [Usnea florida]